MPRLRSRVRASFPAPDLMLCVPDGMHCRRNGRVVMHRTANPLTSVRFRLAPPSMQDNAGIAQLVERNLAKVEVASSSLVVRSEGLPRSFFGTSTVGWPRGEATDCKSVYTGSNPVSTSIARSSPGMGSSGQSRAIGAVVARFLDTEEVTGSNPVSPTSAVAPRLRPDAPRRRT